MFSRNENRETGILENSRFSILEIANLIQAKDCLISLVCQNYSVGSGVNKRN